MAASKQPPRDLKSLLSDLREPTDLDRSPWAKDFRRYLKARSGNPNADYVSDFEAKFDFIVVAGVLKAKSQEIVEQKWRRREIDSERIELLQIVGTSFFGDNTPTQIALSNKELRKELVTALEAVSRLNEADSESSSGLIDDASDLVWEARCDRLVYKDGVDGAYNKYLLTKPTPPMMTAVLLSIL